MKFVKHIFTFLVFAFLLPFAVMYEKGGTNI